MSASTLDVGKKPATSRATFQDLASRKVAAFLAAGSTGKVVLNVKEGRILAYEITEAGRIGSSELDSSGGRTEDSER